MRPDGGMPRQIRIEFPGAFYHVMARGDRREAIFEDDEDLRRFLDTLGEACGFTGWKIHAYVLMGNHYHLLVETAEANLVRGMTWLQGTYTKRYNARHRMSGHLFGGRYKAVLVQAGRGEYYSCLLDYIHLNPVRAGIVTVGKELDSYPWSSLVEYRLPPTKRRKWMAVGFGLDSRGLPDTEAGRRRFLGGLESRVGQEAAEKAGLTEIDGQSLHSSLRRGWFFGDRVFCEKLKKLSADAVQGHRESGNYRGSEMKAHDETRAEEIVSLGLEVIGLGEADLTKLPMSDDRKALIALEVRSSTTMSLK